MLKINNDKPRPQKMRLSQSHLMNGNALLPYSTLNTSQFGSVSNPIKAQIIPIIAGKIIWDNMLLKLIFR